MSKFRKLPVVIEAVQWFKAGDHPEVVPLPLDHAAEIHAIWPSDFGWVQTLEGGHVVTPGDWIVRGVKGELYPCKPDIFEATYEPVE